MGKSEFDLVCRNLSWLALVVYNCFRLHLKYVEPLIVMAGDVECLPVGTKAKHIVGDVATQSCSNCLGVQRQVHASFVA